MGPVTGKKLFSIMALCAMIGLLLLPILVAIPALAGDGASQRLRVKKEGGDAKVEKGKDVYYKTEGIVVGAPAPKTTDGAKDYPRYNFESRVLLWFANQQHLYYGSFVLAVPIFCMIIEFMGVVTKDKAMAKRYDQLAYDFIKISLTAYSLDGHSGRYSDLYLSDSLSRILRISVQYLPASHAHLCVDVRGGERNSLHLLLWLGQDEGGVPEVDSSEHVGGLECHRHAAHVPGEFLDRLHDVAGRSR